MALARASTSAMASTTVMHSIAPLASTSKKHMSTTAAVWGKSPPGKGKGAQRKARQLARLEAAGAGQRATSKHASTIMNLAEAVKLFQAVEVARPLNAYELHVCTSVDSHQANALRGRLALPKEARTKAERLLIFAEDDSEAANAVQSMLNANPSAKDTIIVGGSELINDVVSGSGAAAGLNFSKVLCTEGLLPQLTRSLARSLGPRGLMPSAKRGSVVSSAREMEAAIRDAKGALDWRGDRNGVVRGAIGRIHFSEGDLRANIAAFLHGILEKISAGLTSGSAQTGVAVPSSEVGKFTTQEMKRAMSIIKQVHLSSTQGPAVLLPHNEVL